MFLHCFCNFLFGVFVLFEHFPVWCFCTVWAFSCLVFMYCLSSFLCGISVLVSAGSCLMFLHHFSIFLFDVAAVSAFIVVFLYSLTFSILPSGVLHSFAFSILLALLQFHFEWCFSTFSAFSHVVFLHSLTFSILLCGVWHSFSILLLNPQAVCAMFFSRQRRQGCCQWFRWCWWHTCWVWWRTPPPTFWPTSPLAWRWGLPTPSSTESWLSSPLAWPTPTWWTGGCLNGK